MDLIIGVIAAFFLGGVSGYLLRATRDDASADDSTAGNGRRGARAGGSEAKQGRRDTASAGTGRGHGSWAGRPGELPGGVRTADPGPPIPPRPATVLLADDRMELVALHRANLERHGYRVVTATDGDTALAIARAEHPSVAVLDHSMPGRSGIDVARALKKDPATSDIVVLLMTAHSYGAIGASAREAGCSGFMSKPCDPARVLREVAVYATPTH